MSAAVPRQYLAIDLKSFYASVECVERGLDPLDVCLVVADIERTEKTICLAVSPALKKFGTGGRPRLFEVVQKVREANTSRAAASPGHRLRGQSTSGAELAADPSLAIDYIVARPRMGKYMEYSTRIFDIYMDFVTPEDIHVYSVDEAFIDLTSYLPVYGMSAHELSMTIIRRVLKETGITATAGIGTNLYLCKIAMDIVAKKMPADKDGVRIAELTEESYRRQLWTHRPLKDFWRVGRGTANRLAPYGILTMGDIARCSLRHEDLLYRLFGVNAELLIDHAWGWEPLTLADVKAYRPDSHSMSKGQVLHSPYTFDMALTVIQEMAESMALSLFDKGLTTNQLVLHIGYDVESLKRKEIRTLYNGPVDRDWYGREVPRHAHVTVNLPFSTSSMRRIMDATVEGFRRAADPLLLIRRMNICANSLVSEAEARKERLRPVRLDLFTDYEEFSRQRDREESEDRKTRKLQETMLSIKKRFGKNALLRGLNFAEGATQRMRNGEIGGHRE